MRNTKLVTVGAMHGKVIFVVHYLFERVGDKRRVHAILYSESFFHRKYSCVIIARWHPRLHFFSFLLRSHFPSRHHATLRVTQWTAYFFWRCFFFISSFVCRFNLRRRERIIHACPRFLFCVPCAASAVYLTGALDTQCLSMQCPIEMTHPCMHDSFFVVISLLNDYSAWW